jgi:hypothetical protein
MRTTRFACCADSFGVPTGTRNRVDGGGGPGGGSLTNTAVWRSTHRFPPAGGRGFGWGSRSLLTPSRTVKKNREVFRWLSCPAPASGDSVPARDTRYPVDPAALLTRGSPTVGRSMQRSIPTAARFTGASVGVLSGMLSCTSTPIVSSAVSRPAMRTTSSPCRLVGISGGHSKVSARSTIVGRRRTSRRPATNEPRLVGGSVTEHALAALAIINP